MIYCFDLDETLCTKAVGGDYATAKPLTKAITEVNKLYDAGHRIVIFTGRGSSSGKEWRPLTEQQLTQWGIKHHELITGRKPTYDVVIDDKAINAADWRKTNCGVKGIVAGAFDLIHPGYCRLFKFCREHSDHLTVMLHDDPSIERNKLKPVHTLQERIEILQSIKYIDKVITYKFEQDLLDELESGNYDVRFLGEDYKNKVFTGSTLSLDIIYTNRDHGYSTTLLKQKVADSYLEFTK